MDIIIQNGKLNFSEMAKREKIKNEAGLIKKNYSDFNRDVPGPYYDLQNAHLHIWRKANIIVNFKGPQDQKRIQFVNREWDSECVFCSICHCKVICNTGFSRLKIKNDKPVSIGKLKIDYDCKWVNMYNRLNNNESSIIKIKEKKIKIFANYYKIVYKLLNKPILYRISHKETKLIWPWQLTNYQKFKLQNTDYKNNIIFLKPKEILTNYVLIE